MSGARSAILGRIRTSGALGGGAPEAEYEALHRAYRQTSELTRSELIELFASRIVHYDGSVLRCVTRSLPDTIQATMAARGKTRLHIPGDLESSWLPAGLTAIPGADAAADELDRSEGVLTGCTVAIALTGTMVLTHSRGEGRRALTLVPDYHLAIVFAEQIVETVPEAMRRIGSSTAALITTISGPSATADIEMTRIKGVHGPRTLDVVIVTE